MKDLLVVTPSRGRPHNIERLWEAMQATCRADTRLLIGIDSDDETYGEYPAGPFYMMRDDLQRRVGEWMNYLAVPHTAEYRVIGHFGDDCVPRTDGWDERILEALHKTPFAFGNDLSAARPAGSLPTHIFMHRRAIRSLGYMAPGGMRHLWIDMAWLAWGEAAGIAYLDDVIIEHMHFMDGKAEMDDSYALSRQLTGTDLAHLHDYVRTGLNADIARIAPSHPGFTEREFYEMLTRRGVPVRAPLSARRRRAS